MWAGCEVWVLLCPERGTVLAAQCAQSALKVRSKCAQKCTKDKCAHVVTRVHNKNDLAPILPPNVHQMYQNVGGDHNICFLCTLWSFQLVGRRELRGWSEGQSMAQELM
jgi:hypothetical protein